MKYCVLFRLSNYEECHKYLCWLGIELTEQEQILRVTGAHRLLENMKQRTWNDEDINSDMNTLLDKVLHTHMHTQPGFLPAFLASVHAQRVV